MFKSALNMLFLFIFTFYKLSSYISCNYFSIELNKKVIPNKTILNFNFIVNNYLEIKHILQSAGTDLVTLPSNIIHNQTSVMPLYNFQNVQYFGYLFVGSDKQKFSVIFDTGSNLLWLPSIDCGSCRSFVNKFDYKSSSSFITENLQKNITVSILIIKIFKVCPRLR